MKFESPDTVVLRHALSALGDVSSVVHPSSITVAGNAIPVATETGYLRGHGTLEIPAQQLQSNNGATSPDDMALVASVCGVIERVNKLVTVRSFASRYTPETGDVVVGRIAEVSQKRWKVDVGSAQFAQLMISAVNLPGGAQRRRTGEDELTMRSLYTEGDLISAEVQSCHGDGTMALHTRSIKYGKLSRGLIVTVPPPLIRKMKHHFHSVLDNRVALILGCNGRVWVGESAASVTEGGRTSGNDSTTEVAPQDAATPVGLDLRQMICRLAASVRALSAIGASIHPESVQFVYEFSKSNRVGVVGMSGPEFLLGLVGEEVEKRTRAVGISSK